MFDYLNFGPMVWITLYIIVLIIAFIWTFIMDRLISKNPKLEEVSDSGIAILGLTGGALAVGFVTIGLKNNPGVFILLVLTIGVAPFAFMYLKFRG